MGAEMRLGIKQGLGRCRGKGAGWRLRMWNWLVWFFVSFVLSGYFPDTRKPSVLGSAIHPSRPSFEWSDNQCCPGQYFWGITSNLAHPLNSFRNQVVNMGPTSVPKAVPISILSMFLLWHKDSLDKWINIILVLLNIILSPSFLFLFLPLSSLTFI